MSKFDEAVKFVSGRASVNQTVQLELYGLYKVATVGNAAEHGKKPSMFDFVGQAKYKAWAGWGDMRFFLFFFFGLFLAHQWCIF
jgi:acyl-CoA-binding protein